MLAAARVRFYARAARILERLRRYDAAANAYARILRIWPNDSYATSQRFFLLGCGFQYKRRHAEAVDAFREAARSEPGRAEVHYNCATCLVALQRWEEAAEAFQHAVDQNPSDAEGWARLGEVLAVLGRWKEAAPCQGRAVRLAPSLDRRLDLGYTLYELNRLDEAERVMRDALAHDGRSREGRGLLAMVLAGQDRYDEALPLAREICALNPSAASSRAILAGVLAEAGRLDEALAEAQATIALAPGDLRSYLTLGFVCLKRNDGAGALAAFERMAECLAAEPVQIPASSVWLQCKRGRGDALSLLGRHEEAMATFDELLCAAPDYFERWPDMASHYERSSGETGRSQGNPR